MKQIWTTDEIIENFTLLPTEMEFLGNNDAHNHLGKALLLKCFQYDARFPESRVEIPQQAIDYIAQQLDLTPTDFEMYKWRGRSIKNHRKAIRELMGFHPATLENQGELRDWLQKEMLPDEYRPVYLEEEVYKQCRKLHIEPPSHKQVKRLITSAIHHHEQAFFMQIAEHLSPEVKIRLRALIEHTGGLDEDLSVDTDEVLPYPIHELKAGAGNAKVKNIKRVCTRLKQLQAIELIISRFIRGVSSAFSTPVSSTSGS